MASTRDNKRIEETTQLRASSTPHGGNPHDLSRPEMVGRTSFERGVPLGDTTCRMLASVTPGLACRTKGRTEALATGVSYRIQDILW